MSPHLVHFRTGDQALVREINLSVIMNCLRQHAPISRAALADMTGLNKTTVSSLVKELIDHQFVHEVGLDSAHVGRPSMLLELNPRAGFIVSGEIGVDYISVIRANFAAEIVWRHQEGIRQSLGQQAIIKRVLDLLHQSIESGDGARGNLLGLALGVPGLVDLDSGKLLFAPNLKWEDVPLRDILSREFGAPVFVDNEANMAALGEHFFWVAQGYNEVLFISVGVGLGGGIVQGGRLLRGASGFAGEFGHMTIEVGGEPCNCGNRGCWETLVSQSALFRRIRHAVEGGQPSVLENMVKGDWSQLSVPMVVDAAYAGDQVALGAFEQIGHYLGVGIASLVNAFNPDLVVLGGILSLAGEFLLPIIKTELHQHALRWNVDTVQIALSRHGLDACVMGGMATVYQAILAQPGSVERQAV